MSVELWNIERTSERIDSTIALLEKSYQRLIGKLDTFVRNRDYKAITIAEALSNVEQMLVESGYYKALSIDAQYQQALEDAITQYSKLYGVRFKYSEMSMQELSLMKDANIVRFTSLTDSGKSAISDAVFSLRFGSLTPAEASDMLENVVDASLRKHINTWVDTAQTAFTTKAQNDISTDAGITRFKYIGANDKITRPFCRQHIGEIRTLAEWDTLDNGQLSPVSLYRGGYRCRHSLIGVYDAK